MPRLASLCLVAAAACAGADPSAPPPRVDAGVRRFVKQPRGEVLAFPPHAIRTDGVGPFRVGSQLSRVLHSVTEWPHIELMQVGDLADWRVVRAEGGRLLIGADDKNLVTFVAVLGPGVARTEGGIEVGATLESLLATLGPEVARGDRARDPRIHEVASLPGVRFLTDAPASTPPSKTRVVAVLITGDQEAGPLRSGAERRGAEEEPPIASPPPPCRAGGDLARAEAEIVVAARRSGVPLAPPPPAGVPAVIRFGCFTSDRPEALAAVAGEVVIVGGEPGKLRRLAAVPLAAGDTAEPLDVDRDGRDELIVFRHARTVDARSVRVQAYRWETGRLAPIVDERPFVITREVARASGVTPPQIDLIVEARPDRDVLVVDAVYLAGLPVAVWDLAPLASARLPVARRGSALPPADAGPRSDAVPAKDSP